MEKIILMTTLFRHDNPQRMEEFRKCITINVQHPSIDKIVIFFEQKNNDATLFDLSYLDDKKIVVEKIKVYPTFKLFFNYANEYLKGDYIIIANTDIYFDKECGIEKVRNLKRDCLWVLTRYNYNSKNDRWELEDGDWPYHDVEMFGSHDAWCFLSPIMNFDNDLLLGKMGCDLYLSQKAVQASITVVNPSYSIKIKHEHKNRNKYPTFRDYCLYKDYMRFGKRSCYPPISQGEKALTTSKRKKEIIRYYIFMAQMGVRIGAHLKTHYQIIRNEGLRKYFLYSYHYRIGKLRKIFGMGSSDLAESKPLSDILLQKLKLISKHRIRLVLDVGANTGQFANQIRSIGYKGRLISFEPLGSAYRKLAETAKSDPLWETFHFALGSENTKGKINISANSWSSSILDMLPSHLKSAPESAYIGKEEIVIRRLDSVFPDICKNEDGIYMKIDTQGYEKQVLEGTGNVLENIDIIQLEMSLVPLYKDEMLFSEMHDLLYQKGYVFSDPETGQLLQVDGTFRRIKKD
jgi:FkbM family methyltransferase